MHVAHAQRWRVRVLIVAVLVAVGVLVVALVSRESGPDYAGIRSCTRPQVVPAHPVAVDPVPISGLDQVEVADIERATVLVPWIDGQRLLVANRDGFVWLLDPTSGERSLVLDLSDRIELNAEGGIIGGALSPDGAHLYLHHTDRAGTSRILELETEQDGVIAASERELLSKEHPGLVHNGGAIVFGPDGFLYVGFGDGGGRPEDAERVASLGHLDGKILRLDPDATQTDPYAIPAGNPYIGSDSTRPEIWLTGLRNPYRFTFDQASGDIWVGDVGEACYEEINVVVGGESGLDLGFPRFEGNHEFLGGSADGSMFPVVTHPHEEGWCAVIMGVAVTDPELPQLRDRILYGDFCAGGLRWVERQGDQFAAGTLDVEVEGVMSFGTGPAGEVYVLTGQRILRLVASG